MFHRLLLASLLQNLLPRGYSAFRVQATTYTRSVVETCYRNVLCLSACPTRLEYLRSSLHFSSEVIRIISIELYFTEFVNYALLSIEVYDQMTVSGEVEKLGQEAIRHENKIVPVLNL
jgi:hypothetical protein